MLSNATTHSLEWKKVRENQITLHWPNLHIPMDNLCLRWRGNLVSCITRLSRSHSCCLCVWSKTCKELVRALLSLQRILAQSKNEVKGEPQQLLNCYTYTVLLTRRHTFPLHLVWYRKKAPTHEHNIFDISPFQMFSSCWETKQNLTKLFTKQFCSSAAVLLPAAHLHKAILRQIWSIHSSCQPAGNFMGNYFLPPSWTKDS